MRGAEHVATPPIARLLFAGTLVAVAAVVCVLGGVLWQMRQDAWEHARQASQNLLTSIAGNIDANMRVYSFALDLGATAWESGEASTLSAETRHRLLGTIADKARHVAVVFVLDRNGMLTSESEIFPSREFDLGDRDYFQVHRERADAGHFLSTPHLSRLREGEPFFAMSRRLNAPDGSFAGVIVMSVRLSYFANLFQGLDLGRDGEIGISTRDGATLMRYPDTPGRPLGFSLKGSDLFERMKAEGSGTFVATVGGVERLYSFAPIPAESLILSVGVSVDEILADWRARATAIGAVTLVVCAALVALAFLLRAELRRRAVAEADLAFLSVTDGLTGLPNRRHFDEIIQREWRRTGRRGASLALLFLDVDRFKVLNDRYGHARGDEVLKVIARVIEASIRRPGDMGARYGGEEFAVILPDTDAKAAAGIAETIRSGIERATGPDTGWPQTTVSIGVNAVGPGTNLSIADLLAGADKALYRAKAEGRNRVASYV
ncbi:MAG: sensor domain-containing diguanylate cyclase [Pseudomonadota bacterium]